MMMYSRGRLSSMGTHDSRLIVLTYNISPRLGAQSIQVSRLLSHIRTKLKLIYGDSSIEGGLRVGAYESLGKKKDSVQIKPLVNSNNILSRILFKTLPFLDMFPDRIIFWSLRSYINLLFSRDLSAGYRGVLSFGTPMSLHILGSLLSRKMNIPHILYYSDPWPWNENPYHKGTSLLVKQINKKLESWVLSNSQHCIFSNKAVANFYKDRYPRITLSVLGHSYDEQLYERRNDREAKNRKVMTVRTIGDFYGPRSPNPLLISIHQYIQDHPEIDLSQMLKVEIYGRCNEKNLNHVIKELGLKEIIFFKGRVSYIKSLELMSRADLLLLIDAKVSPNLYFPSKLADYLGSKVPIIGLTDRDGPAGQILSSTGNKVIDHADEGTLMESIYSKLFLEDVTSMDAYEEYEIRAVAKKFDAIIDSVIPVKA